VQPMSFAILIMSLFLIYRHRSNIRNLMNGTETRLAKRK
jgi:glycerol-3-phosphate acyltransferase PlsY